MAIVKAHARKGNKESENGRNEFEQQTSVTVPRFDDEVLLRRSF